MVDHSGCHSSHGTGRHCTLRRGAGSTVPPSARPGLGVWAKVSAPQIGGDLVGVDLLPLPGGGYIVIEVNVAVDFDAEESLPGRDMYLDTANALALAAQLAAQLPHYLAEEPIAIIASFPRPRRRRDD